MIKWVVVWYLVFGHGGNEGYVYQIPYSSQKECLSEKLKIETKQFLGSPEAKCTYGKLPVFVPK